jgi:hypothetical protein
VPAAAQAPVVVLQPPFEHAYVVIGVVATGITQLARSAVPVAVHALALAFAAVRTHPPLAHRVAAFATHAV